jgi:uncharacterized membrane protein
MLVLLLGLVIFLGVHSTRIVAEGWRTRMLAKLGENGWKGAYSIASLAGFVLIVIGYGMARQESVVLWNPPIATRHIAGLLMLASFILLVAAYVPGNGIKSRLRHPMVLSVKVWALAHLLSNGTLADVLLFAGFLVWAVLSFRAARGRDREAGVVGTPGKASATAITVLVGAIAWAVFAFWAHRVVIGVRPFG